MRKHDPGKNIRPLRVAAEIMRDMPSILRERIEMPFDVMISVTDVEVSDDLSYAKIFFSILGGEAEADIPQRVQQHLNAHKGVVRHELAQRLVMRQHPEVRFIYDATPARAARIEELLKQVRGETQPNGEEQE